MPTVPLITLGFLESLAPVQLVYALQILALLAMLSAGPMLLIAITSFARIVIVLSFVKQALRIPLVPPRSIVVTLALLLTCAVLAPLAHQLDMRALSPYSRDELDARQALDKASGVVRDFLTPQTRAADLRVVHELSHEALPKARQAVRLQLLVPAFMLSELRTAFELGLLIFVPFLLIDLIVTWLLTTFGMVLVPPTLVATPLKLALFVAVGGLPLLARSLVAGFG